LSRPIKRALIICDMQPDCIPSLFAKSNKDESSSTQLGIDPVARREAFINAVQYALISSISNPMERDNAFIIFNGLKFPSGYEGLDPEHPLYGSLVRFNKLLGDEKAHWFMDGYTSIDSTLMDILNDKNEGVVNESGASPVQHAVIWRQGHIPAVSTLSEHLSKNAITDVTVVGAKASQAVQATIQILAEYHPGIDVSVVKEAIADDSEERLNSMVQHLLPLYSRVASLEEYVEATCGLEHFAQAMERNANEIAMVPKKRVCYYVNCERGGHFSIYIHHLTNRKSTPMAEGTYWVSHPKQKWYEDIFCAKQFHCPLGKGVVDFCDEPAFSKVSMFLKGRDCLDDKGKLLALAKDFMPETYIIEGGRECWDGIDCPPELNKSSGASSCDATGPWFVKETNKNGGRAITVCRHASECLALANNPQETYVIQRHVLNPSMLTDGRKWHLKMYNLLICEEDGVSWTLRCNKEAFLCAASTLWSAENTSAEAQLTIRRTKRFRDGASMSELGNADYSDMFRQCTEIVSTVVQRAIEGNGLQGRPGKKQFEMFSTDFVFDATMNKANLIEFNFSPVVYDPLAKQELTTIGMKVRTSSLLFKLICYAYVQCTNTFFLITIITDRSINVCTNFMETRWRSTIII
jgi:nicotinamidase-related amidase